MTSIADVNAMTDEAFVAAFGDVAEHSPWFAAQAGARRPFKDREDMVNAFALALRDAGQTAQLDLLRAHPDLATRARLAPVSAREQKGAGLDTLTASEFQRFTELNACYKKKFGFPFIFAVKGATKSQIIESFEARINNGKADEFDMALTQVMRIFRFRIEDRVSP
jgi:2-oxo-4-hydroxy-4-carboxy-5-ureidoimidazoline decarboxylase